MASDTNWMGGNSVDVQQALTPIEDPQAIVIEATLPVIEGVAPYQIIGGDALVSQQTIDQARVAVLADARVCEAIGDDWAERRNPAVFEPLFAARAPLIAFELLNRKNGKTIEATVDAETLEVVSVEVWSPPGADEG